MTSACPVCGGSARSVFLERDRVPVMQNAPQATAEAARACGVGALRLAVCEGCAFVWNELFDAALVPYGDDYENDQSHSPSFAVHLDALVERLLAQGVRGKRVLEVGCGAGRFLGRLCAAGGNRGLGFDPAYRGPETALDGAVRFVARHYRGGADDEADADAVLSRHVIEHVPEPRPFLQALRAACGRPGARLFLETPAVDWILDRVVVQDFFYEHCSYFSAGSLRHAVETAGFRVREIATVFGGQYLWLEAEAGPGGAAALPRSDEVRAQVARARRYGEEASRRLDALRARTAGLAASGAVAIWGAGAKGVTLANLLDPGARLVVALVDINPRKQGMYVPGSGHPIVAPSALAALGATDVVVMNPNYAAEIEAAARSVVPGIRLHVCDET